MNFTSKEEKFIFYVFPIILFSLIPFFLITGPFLSDLSVSIISLLFLVYCLRKKNFLYFKNKYFYFFLFFWIYLIVNTFINNFNLDSLKISFFYFRYGVFVIAIATFLNVDSKFIKYFFFSIFICFSVLIIDGFYQYFFQKNILGWQGSDRISSFFGDENILGSYLSRLWPIFFGLSIFIFKQKNKLYYIFLFVFILSEALIFLSGDRTAFFYINLSAIFVILFSQKLLKLRLITLLSSLLLLVIISFFNPTAKERVVDLTLSQMNLVQEKIDGNDQRDYNDQKDQKDEKDQKIYIFTKAHHELYVSAYKIFLDNIIFGVGVKNFRNICKDQRYYVDNKEVCNTHPHNTYVQILTELGIVGLIFLLFSLFYFCLFIFKHLFLKFRGKYYFNDFEICLLSGIVIYLWPFVPTGNVFSNWLNISMIINLPFLVWSRKVIKFRN